MKCAVTHTVPSGSLLTCDLPEGHSHQFHIYKRCIGEHPPFFEWRVGRLGKRGMSFAEYDQVFTRAMNEVRECA